MQVARDVENVERSQQGRKQQHGEKGHVYHHQQFLGQKYLEDLREFLYRHQIGKDLVEKEAEHQHEEQAEEQEEDEFFLLAAHQGIAQLQELKLQQAFHGGAPSGNKIPPGCSVLPGTSTPPARPGR